MKIHLNKEQHDFIALQLSRVAHQRSMEAKGRSRAKQRDLTHDVDRLVRRINGQLQQPSLLVNCTRSDARLLQVILEPVVKIVIENTVPNLEGRRAAAKDQVEADHADRALGRAAQLKVLLEDVLAQLEAALDAKVGA